MTVTVTYEDDLPMDQVGNKFYNLARLSRNMRVPPAICLRVDAFKYMIDHELLKYIESCFQDIKSTIGYDLLETTSSLRERFAVAELLPDIKVTLESALVGVFGELGDSRFAVRSSSTAEDTTNHSYAGIYETVLDVKGIDEICKAVLECWQSYYSFSAIAARLRASVYDPYPKMAVIIQRMVTAEYSGIAFIYDNGGEDEVKIEYVEGLGDRLVSGLVSPKVFEGDYGVIPTAQENKIIREVSRIAKKVKKVLMSSADIEWSWEEEQLWILQARPITAYISRKNRKASDPVFAVNFLYDPTGVGDQVELNECSEIYSYYIGKRGKAYELAEKMSIDTGAGYVITFNGLGLKGNVDKLHDLMMQSLHDKVVVDVNNNLRQIVLEKGGLRDFLLHMFDDNDSTSEVHSVIIRDFIVGDLGFITCPTDEGKGIFIEYSAAGLLGINRGTANCESIYIADIGHGTSGAIVSSEGRRIYEQHFCPEINKISSFTKALCNNMDVAQLEWVLDKGRVYFIDFTRGNTSTKFSSGGDVICVSEGNARGSVLVLEENVLLERLSVGPAISVDKLDNVIDHSYVAQLIRTIQDLPEKPIVAARKPYAILAILCDHVAGFVFAEGSVLCHLGILLREYKIPTLICKELDVEQGDYITLSPTAIFIEKEIVSNA